MHKLLMVLAATKTRMGWQAVVSSKFRYALVILESAFARKTLCEAHHVRLAQGALDT